MTETLEWLAAHRDILTASGAALAALLTLYLGSQRLPDARGTHLHARLQQGEKMLASPSIPTRISGIYELRRLAIDRPADNHVIVMRTPFTYMREHMRVGTKPDLGVIPDPDTVWLAPSK